MKTLIIYDTIVLAQQYCLVDGDFSRFNGVIFNSTKIHSYEDECYDFLYDENGDEKLTFSEDISLLESKQWDKIAIITFLP